MLNYLKNNKHRYGSLGTYLVLIFTPYVYLFAYWLPGLPFRLGVANDFEVIYYDYKVYLLEHFQRCSFPLWSPSEACGFPLIFNPFVQYFYPFNLPLALYYKLTGSYTLVDHQIFTIFGISILSVGIYKWLKSFGFDTVIAVASSILIGLSFKSTELIRFPNAVHTFAWIPFILFGINQIYIHDNKKGAWYIFFSVICMITAGYVYYLFYAVFLLVPYTLFISTFYGGASIKNLRKLIFIGLPSFIGLLVCSPYLYGIADLMKHVVDRGGASLVYSINGGLSILNYIGSFVFPPSSYFDGWFYLGMMPLWLIVANLANVKFTRENAVFLFFLSFLVLTPFLTCPKHSSVFLFLWKYMPGFSSLRNWGRFNIYLLPGFAYMLAQSLAYIKKIRFKELEWSRNQSYYLFSCFVVFLLVQLFLFISNSIDSEWYGYIVTNIKFSQRLRPVITGSFIFFNVLSFLFFISVQTNRLKIRYPKLIFLFVILGLADTFLIGSTQWACLNYKGKTVPASDLATRNSLQNKRVLMYGMISLDSVFNAGIVDNWYLNDYVLFLKKEKIANLNPDQDVELNKNIKIISQRLSEAHEKHQKIAEAMFAKLYQLDENKLELALINKTNLFKDSVKNKKIQPILRLLGSGKEKIFITKSIKYSSCSAFLKDHDSLKAKLQPQMHILNYTGDVLSLELTNNEPVFLSFIDNDAKGWHCYVDQKEVGIKKLFGTFKSVEIESGTHNVYFRYQLW